MDPPNPNTSINIEDMKYLLEKVRQFGFQCNESAKEVTVYLTSLRTRDMKGTNWKDMQSEVSIIMEHFKGVFDRLHRDVLEYSSVELTNGNNLNPEGHKKKLNMSLLRKSDDEYTFDSDSNMPVTDEVPEVTVQNEDIEVPEVTVENEGIRVPGVTVENEEIPRVLVKNEGIDNDNLGRISPTPSATSTVILDIDNYQNVVDFEQEEPDNITVSSDVDKESEESYVFDLSDYYRNTYENGADDSLSTNVVPDRLHDEFMIDDVKDEINNSETEKLSLSTNAVQDDECMITDVKNEIYNSETERLNYVEPSIEYENLLCPESISSDKTIQAGNKICDEDEPINLNAGEEEKLLDEVDDGSSDSSDSYIRLSNLDDEPVLSTQEIKEVLKLGEDDVVDQDKHADIVDQNQNADSHEHGDGIQQVNDDKINFLAYFGLRPVARTENDKNAPLPQVYNTRLFRKKHQDANEIFRKLLNLRDTDSEASSDDDSSSSESIDGESSYIKDDSEFGSIFDSDIQTMEISTDEETSTDKDSDSPKDMRYYEEKYNLMECKVTLTKLKDAEIETEAKKASKEPNIDRLCNIKNLNKRRHSNDNDDDADGKVKSKRRKRSSSDKENSSLHEDNDIDPSSDVETPHIDTLLLQSDDDLDKDEALAEIFCENIELSDSDYSEESNGDSTKVKGTESRNKHRERTKNPPDERDKAKWKNDKLLKSNLQGLLGNIIDLNTILPLEEKDDSSKIQLISSDSSEYESESSADVEFEVKKKRVEKHFNKIKLKKDYSTSSSLSSSESEEEEDSEIEFVAVPDKPNADTDSALASQSSVKSGRKNIRQVMDDKDLAEATKKARKEEQKRIMRLESASNSFADLEEDKFVLEMGKNDESVITVDPILAHRLKPHQRSGVAFMWESCFESVEHFKTTDGSGCILAHCMGLGKTFQVITLIHTLFTHEDLNFNHALVVCPVSTVRNWQHEFKIGLKNVENKLRVFIIGEKKRDKISAVKSWWHNKGILILGYEAYENLTNEAKIQNIADKKLIEKALVNPGPQLIVCDEGHLLKNGKTLRTKALMKVTTKRRIVLTGTPLQNNLKEYYYMVQFVKPNLLGTYKEYKNTFVNPIENGQYDDSSAQDIRRMKQRTHVLHKLLKRAIQRVEVGELKKYLNDIYDYALFVELSDNQINLYKEYMRLIRPEGDDQITQRTNIQFLRDVQYLHLICSHPYLLYLRDDHVKKRKHVKEYDTIDDINADILKPSNIPSKWYVPVCPDDVKEKLDYGYKFIVMQSIIEEAEKIGDKVLLFSHSIMELDAIEHFLKTVGTSNCKSWSLNKDYFRMDGTVPPFIRTQLCDVFNNPKNPTGRLFMMSYRVGGLGLNLVAANRVILMGANFNPSHDTQGIYRAYRFGQTKPCYVYRLLSMGTMEEIIYKRCITKLAQAGRVIDKYQIDRHYNRKHITELYNTLPERKTDRPTPSVPVDDLLAKVLQKNKIIYNYHEHEALLENRPDEALTEAEKNSAWEEFNRKDEVRPMPIPPNQLPNNFNTRSQPGSNLEQIKQLLLGAVAANNKPLIFELMRMIDAGVAGCDKEQAIKLINSATELQRRGIKITAAGHLFLPNDVFQTNQFPTALPAYIPQLGKLNTTIEATNAKKPSSTQTVIDRSIPTSSQNPAGISGVPLQNLILMTGQQVNTANKLTLPPSTSVSSYKVHKLPTLKNLSKPVTTSNLPGNSVPLSQPTTKHPPANVTVSNSNVSTTSGGLPNNPTTVSSVPNVPTCSTATLSKPNVTNLPNNKDRTLTNATSEAKQVGNILVPCSSSSLNKTRRNYSKKQYFKNAASNFTPEQVINLLKVGIESTVPSAKSTSVRKTTPSVTHSASSNKESSSIKDVINPTEAMTQQNNVNKTTVRKTDEGSRQNQQRINPLALQKRNVIAPSRYTKNMVSVFSHPVSKKQAPPLPPPPPTPPTPNPNLQSTPSNGKIATPHPVIEKNVLPNLQNLPCNVRKIPIPSTNVIPSDSSSDITQSITKSSEDGKVIKKKKSVEVQASPIFYRGSKSLRKENTASNVPSNSLNDPRNKLQKTQHGVPHQVPAVKDRQAPVYRVIKKHKNPLQESTVNSDVQKKDTSSPQVAKNYQSSNAGDLKIVNVRGNVNSNPEDDIVFVGEGVATEKEKIFTALKRNGVVRVSPKGKGLDETVASKEK